MTQATGESCRSGRSAHSQHPDGQEAATGDVPPPGGRSPADLGEVMGQIARSIQE